MARYIGAVDEAEYNENSLEALGLLEWGVATEVALGFQAYNSTCGEVLRKRSQQA